AVAAPGSTGSLPRSVTCGFGVRPSMTPERNMTHATPWGTPLSATARKLLLLGSGELGKEVVIEAQRLGIEVIACDRYANAPAMQVAHRCHVLDMTDPAQLRKVIELEDPDWVVPEIEAIATPELERL